MNPIPNLSPEQLAQLSAILNAALSPAAPNSTAPAEGSTPVDAPAQPSSAVEPDDYHASIVREFIYQGAPKPKKAKAPDYVSAAVSHVTRQFSVLALWPLIVVALVLSGLVYWYAPAKILVIAYGIAKLALFAVSGALTDYLLFPDDAPETLQGVEQGTAWKRRTWIVCAAIVAGALLP